MTFPHINVETFSEKDKIYHSLIEAKLFCNYSNDYMLSMIRKLNEYKEKNGEEIVIDILFMKYLCNSDSYRNNINQLVQTLIDCNETNSQYYFALKYLYDINEIKNQLWKVCTNGNINGIQISKVILFYLLKKNTSLITKDLIIDDFSGNIYENKYELIPYTKNIDENKIKYNEIMKNINQFYSLKFWTDAVINEAISNNTIDVGNNPYLFNAAACLCYENPLIKVNYDISNLKFPEYITLDLVKLIRYELTLENLLQYKAYSIEIKNLCSLVYLLILNQTKFDELEKYKNILSPNSYCILLLVFMNYTKENINDSIFLQYDYSNDFLFYYIFKNMINRFGEKKLSFVNEKEEFFYIHSSRSFNSQFINLNVRYGIFKKKIVYGDFDSNNRKFFDIFKDDFLRFLKESIKNLKGCKKINVIEYYVKFDPNKNFQSELIFGLIDVGEYRKVLKLLNEPTLPPEFNEMLIDELHLSTFLKLLKNIDRNDAKKLIEKFDLKDKIRADVKFDIFLKFSLTYIKLNIDRSKLIEDSVCAFKKNNMKNKFIKIAYVSEKGQDEGGLSKDWFTNVANELVKVNAFVPVPNETKLTFNKYCDNQEIYEFAGKLIALALTNKRNINIRLSSFIWKKIMNECITIEDMNDYDSQLYQSLKWISENDPEPLMMTFVDSNDEELCPNGKNIELVNENKEKFISLMIEKKLIEPNLESINSIVKGFTNIISLNEINILNSREIQDLVNGEENIDFNDWKMNIIHNNAKMYDEFFNIISKWSQENIKKLLKFVTGSSIVPIGGFNYFNKIGGLFKLNFLSYDSERLPQSHTCFNSIDIPYYNSKEKFEQKLLLAIECDSFGFA